MKDTHWNTLFENVTILTTYISIKNKLREIDDPYTTADCFSQIENQSWENSVQTNIFKQTEFFCYLPT